MVLVYVDDLIEGMVLAEDLFTPKGYFVRAEGMPLDEETLKRIKGWGIVEVSITQESLGEAYLNIQEQRGTFVDQAEGYLYRRFIHSDIDQEPVAGIFRLFAYRYTGKIQRGWEPVRCTVDMVPTESDPTLPVPSVPQLLQQQIELFSLPLVHRKAIEALNSMTMDVSEIAEAVGMDSSIVIRLFGLLNSATYELTERVSSVSRAVSLVGLDDILALAAEAREIETFPALPASMIDMELFWRHSLRCGLIARALADRLDLPNTEIYFTGGVVHDIGRLVLLDKMQHHYGRAVIKGLEEHLPLYRAEQETLMTDHCIIGKLLAMRWRLPAELTRMIGGHHSPSSVRWAPEACVVHIADFLAHAMAPEVNLFNEIPPFQIKAWEELNMKEEFIDQAIRQVDGEYRQITQKLFGGG